ncbi:MAG: hypothetical protein KatS3mg023_3333 [Armatimonadota bacterium]|nr:MAG: hypothetical protein KatS3mg023_3333 [Armatimonadota bacterium]
MITVLRARVEGGVLRPLRDIHVTDGQEVEVLLYTPVWIQTKTVDKIKV